MVPALVIVTMLPEIVAGPDFTLRDTDRLLLAVGMVTVKGALP
jgi:hypothetical protein